MSKRGTDAFYVGYQKQADPGLAKIVRRKIILIILGCLAVGAIVAALQTTFGPVTFEFGRKCLGGGSSFGSSCFFSQVSRY